MVAAVVAAVLIAFFSRQGYYAYQAKSNLGAASMQTNAFFKDAGTSGVNPGSN